MNPFVLIRPVITEKSLQMAKESNAYTFLVDPKADKTAIRAALKAAYKIDILDLKTITLPGGTKRTGKKRVRVNVAPRKKAVAILPKGQKIEAFDL